MQQLNCVSLLLLLCFMVAALSSFVATAHRELPMAREDHQEKLVMSGPPAAATPKVGDHQEEAGMRKCKKGRKRSCNNFRTRKLPTDGKFHFDGHMPFTADYHSVRRHPPSHN
uniref:Uncharacterized protein n=1 Tax=Leersia perrieri TaxID=77586 RepID=A0A0D9VD70_9ORYZ